MLKRPAIPGIPPNLIDFMLRDWDRSPRKLPRVMAGASNARRRRNRLSRRFPGELLVIPTGHRKVRANDTHYPFRPGSDFYYLTGALEPDCVLVLFPRGKSHEHLLFVEPNDGKSNPTFFMDGVKGELWEGSRFGVLESQTHYGITCRSLKELKKAIEAFAKKRGARMRILQGISPLIERMIPPGKAQSERNKELATFLSETRLIKDPSEVGALRSAVLSTKRAFEDVIARLKTAKSERELEGVLWTRARMEGNDVGYTSVVASGSHACTMHWNRNDGAIRKGDLLLLDAGIEGRSLYTADITRTFPISGKFNREQREIYELVLAAQRAAIRCVKPGNDFMAPNKAAMIVLAHGLEKLMILPMKAKEALLEHNNFYRRYSLHNVSHMLGLDVHDCAKARAESYKFGKLRPGMVLTIEPGLYFQPDDLTVPKKYRGIGVRIEDDIVVTSTGRRVLSSVFPRNPDKVEKWMAHIWKAH